MSLDTRLATARGTVLGAGATGNVQGSTLSGSDGVGASQPQISSREHKAVSSHRTPHAPRFYEFDNPC